MPESRAGGLPSREPGTLPREDGQEVSMWGIGRNRETGRVFIANDAGQRIDFDPEEVPHLAVGLAQECDDDDMREFVASEWGPRWVD